MSKNIFGKRPEDYQFLMDAKQTDPNYYNSLINKGFTGKGHNFNARPQAANFADAMTLPQFRDNEAQGVTWFSSNIEAIQAEIEEIFYSDFRLYEYFPFVTDIPEGASSYSYRITDSQGTGQFIENYGTDAPTASISAQKVNYNINRGGIKAVWSDEDVRKAIFGGIPLDTDTIKAATTGCMEHIEKVGLGTDTGQTKDRFEGLLTLSNVTDTIATNPLDTLTPDEAIAVLQQYLANIIDSTNEIFGRKIRTPLAIYCSLQFAAYVQTARSSYSNQTIWEFLETRNLWTSYTGQPLKLIKVAEMTTAGEGGSQRILFGYPESTEVWEMGMSISPRVTFINRMDYYYTAPMEYKISGLNVKRPGGLLYVDQIYSG